MTNTNDIKFSPKLMAMRYSIEANLVAQFFHSETRHLSWASVVKYPDGLQVGFLDKPERIRESVVPLELFPEVQEAFPDTYFLIDALYQAYAKKKGIVLHNRVKCIIVDRDEIQGVLVAIGTNLSQVFSMEGVSPLTIDTSTGYPIVWRTDPESGRRSGQALVTDITAFSRPNP